MKTSRKILKGLLFLFTIPVVYLLISLLLTSISVNTERATIETTRTIYLSTNGIHLDVILAKEDIMPSLLSDLYRSEDAKYIAFGWGDENFYLNTPTWNDLTFSTAFQAMFTNSNSLMHVSNYENKQSKWIAINISEEELEKLNNYILASFITSPNGEKKLLENRGYTSIDNFYQANGSYSIIKTCNSWLNTGFKESGLPACLWTPFDFGLINKYE